MQPVKFGGSFGTITGAPGCWDAWPLAATYIQWLNAAVVIGLPAIDATELPGTPPLAPHADSAIASTKKAPSAVMTFGTFIRGGDGSEVSGTRS